MQQSGAFITTTESMLFQLLGDAKHPQFREIQKIVLLPLPKLDSWVESGAL